MNKKNTVISFFLFLSFSSFSFSSQYSLDELAQQSYWLKLGHYRSAIISDWKSEVDDSSFFLADDGKRDPKAELLATINAFNGKDLDAKARQDVICRYPARFQYLKNKVDNNWGELDCIELKKWQLAIDPDAITLVFPTAFMNNPSSMFGHTLLRIDSKDQTRNKDLVAFSVNFAAEADPSDNPATYAIKGLTGSYPGRFALMPYYKKVREYNDLESRDIWEYKLNFTPKEVETVLFHLWELKTAYFDYYFIDENCSYQLLALLQVGRENLDLTSMFNLHAIPSDTVAALRDKGLLQDPKYRAAFGTKLFTYSEQLSDDDLEVARMLTKGGVLEQSDRTPIENAAILEMAYEWLNFEYYDKALKRDVAAPQLTKLLIARSKIRTTSPFLQPERPIASPDEGHGSSRVGLSVSHFKDNQEQFNFSYRFSYHDLLDQYSGFIPGAKISFLDTEASINETGTVRLNRFYFIDAMSLPVDNRIFDSWSWNFRMGFDRQADILKQSGHEFMQTGYGKSIGNANSLQAYFLGSFELNGGDITNNHLKLGVGSEFGALWQISQRNKLGLSSKVMRLIDSDVEYHAQTDLDWNWAFDQNWALRSTLTHQKWHKESNRAKLTLFHYF